MLTTNTGSSRFAARRFELRTSVSAVAIDRALRIAVAAAIVMQPCLASAQQLPTGGAVAAGGATIGTPSNGTLNINQSTDRAIINWNSFSVGAGGTVNFNQPSASSATLNRVTGTTPSSIAGTINAPGTVLLVNPNGIAIGRTGVVNVGSFAASTLDIKDSDFMSGSYKFTGNGASAGVTNAGRINVSDGGFAALLGGHVANDGVITARLGRVGLASGEMVTLDLAGDGFLSVAVPTKSLDKIVDGKGQALVSNKGKIVADGGVVHLSAATAAGILRDAVNVPGSIRANSVGTSNGRIIIGGGAGGRVRVAGHVRANGRNGAAGGRVTVTGADVTVSGKVSAKGATGGSVKLTATQALAVSGTVSATGTTGKGGTVIATADRATIADTARLDVSGTTGGLLLIGGDYQGGVNAANNFSAETIATATTTTVAAGARLIADGTAGNGGRIVVWSEDTTTFAGAISATGTTTGGFAEVSGHRLLDFTGTANLVGPLGLGTLLLDPRNVVISSATGSGGTLSSGTYTPSADDSILNVTTLTTALASGNVVVTTGSSGAQAGNITVASAVSWASGSTLTLTAANNIAINADITAAGGGLTINATNGVTATGAISVGQFTLKSGAWVQNSATLPGFAATSFTIDGGSFLRVTGGDGTAATPYRLADVYGLQGIGSSTALRAANYVLANDIDAGVTATWNGGAGFVPIGNTSAEFYGSLDGAGHVIDGLVINRPSQDYVGLFGYFGSAGVRISNLGIVDARVTGHDHVGILAGNASGTIAGVWTSGTVSGGYEVGGLAGYASANISGSHSTAAVTATGDGVGGLVGRLSSTDFTISTSYATGAVRGNAFVGGIVGEAAGHIESSFATGTVTGSASYIGGLAGLANPGVKITNAYATGAVSGTNRVGGLVGWFDGISVTNTFASGYVNATGAGRGGLIGGKSAGSTVTNSYWDTQTSGLSTSDGGTGVTTATLQAAVPSGWNTGVWGIIPGVSHPFLKSFWSGTPQVVSGNAYTDNFVTPASGTSVAVMVNGTAVGSASVGANGYFNLLLAPGTVGSNSQLAGFTTGANAGVSYMQNATGSITGFNILGNTLFEQSTASTLSAISSGLAVALGSSGVSTSLANRWIVATGSSFTIDQAISQTGVLALSSVGTTTQAAGASISAASLKLQQVSGGVTFVLTESGNAISSLQSGNIGSGRLDLYSSTDLSVGAFTANGGLLVRTAGALTLTGTQSSTASGDAIVLSAGTRFVNNASSTSISTPNGRWLVYAAAPTGNTYNNLNSNNTAVWNATYANNAPSTIASGNRYVFAYQPTLTFTSTNATKYYGTTADVASSYTVTGASAGVTNVFLADTLSSLYTGTPTLSSAGTVATATVAGGPYAITIGQGSVASTGSYAVNFVSSGLLSVEKSSLIVYVGSAHKTYGDTYTGSSGDYTVTGLKNSDQVTGVTLASTGAAATANVGTYALTASDAIGAGLSNYNVFYQPGTLQITQASLTITAASSTKTYGSALAFAGTEFTVAGLKNSDAVAAVTLTSSGAAATANRGTYQITASGATGTGLSNYMISYNPGSLNVTPASLVITANNRSKTYGSALDLGTTGFTIGGTLYNGDTVTGATLYSASAGATAAVGSSTIYVSGATGTGLGNYSISYATGTLTVNPASLTLTAADATKTYGAVAGLTGYTVAGTLYNGDTVTGVSLASAGAAGSANVGSYAINASNATGTGLYNYSITYVPGTLTVNPASLTITAGNQSKFYGNALDLGSTAYSVTGSLYNGDQVTGVTLASSGTAATAAAGSYAIGASNAQGTRLSNYAITYVDGSLTVNKATLIIYAGTANKTYGDTYSSTTAFTASGLKNSDQVTGVTLASAGAAATANVGSYALTGSAALGTGLSNYNIYYQPGTLQVSPAILTITAANQTKTYGTALAFAGTEFTVTGLKNSDAVAAVSLASSGAAATANRGTYQITASGATGTGLSNYMISYNPGSLNVTPASLVITANDQSKTYGSAITLGSTAFAIGGTLYNSDSVTGVTLYSPGSGATAAAGWSTIYASNATGSGLGNYNITYVTGRLTVNPASLTITAADATKTYGIISSLAGYSVAGTLYNGDTLNGVTLASAGAAGSANVGSYAINASNATGTGLYNYSITYVPGTLTVNPASLTITAGNQSKFYGNALDLGSTAYTVTGSLYNGDTVTGVTLASAGAAATAGAGTYAIGASNAQGTRLSNYAITYVDGSLTVNKATLIVYAGMASKMYGDTWSSTTNFTTSGLKNSDQVTGVTLASAGAAATANVGSYALTGSAALGTGLSNYNIYYQPGTLQVSPAILTITGTNVSKPYGTVGVLSGTEFTATGLVNGDSVSSVGLSSAGTAATATVGSYQIAVGGATGTGLSNYLIYYNPGSLAVTRASLTITANDRSKTYGTALDLGTTGFTTTGTLYNGDMISGVSLLSGGAGASASAGAYTLYATGANGTGLSNYAITFVAGTLTVDKASLTVTAADGRKTYDGAAWTGGNGVTYAGFVNGDTAASLGGTLSYGGTGQGAVKAGSYSLTVAGLTSSNYAITFAPGTLTIDRATLTAVAMANNKVYDGTTAATGGITGFVGLVSGDVVSVGGTATFAFTDKNVGTGKSVAVSGLTLTGADAGNYILSPTASTSASITAATLTLATAGTVAGSKVYDGGTAAAVTGNGTLGGVISGDAVTLALTGTAYANKNVGTGKAVTGTYALGGADAGNYVLASTAFTSVADITAATLSIASAGSVAGSKVYDGTTAAAVTGNGMLGGVIAGDAVTLALTGTAYGNKNVGTGKTVTGTYALSGADAGNYVLASNAFTSVADITAATLSIATAGSVAGTKVYDGTTAAAVTGDGTLGGVISGDAVTLALTGTAYGNKNVGTGKAVTGTYALSGVDAGNYVLASNAFTSVADITAATLTLATAGTVAGSKVYDGTTAAAVTGNGTLAGVIGGDAVTLALTGTAYGDKNVGTGKTVTGAYALGGADAGNYVLASTAFTSVADITAATLSIASAGSVAGSKVYDGTTAAAVTGNGMLGGVIAGDAVTLALTGTAYANKNVGTGKAVAGTYALGGADAGNYVLASNAFTSVADITAATLTLATAGTVAGSKVYDGTTAAAVTGNGALAGVIGGDAVTLALTGTAYGDKNVGTAKTVTGTYALSGVDAGNYVLASNAFTTTADVTPASLVITANPQSKQGGDPDPTFTYRVSGTLYGSDTLTGALTRAAGESAGTYAILRGTLAAANYDIAYVGATLTITAESADVTTAEFPTSQYTAPGFATPQAPVTISYQSVNTAPVVLATIAPTLPGRVATPAPTPGGAAVTITAAPSQNVAPAAGTDLAFPSISQFDSTQYTGASLPDWSSGAGEATIAAMVARGLAQTPDAPKIDSLWADGMPRWATIEGVRLGDRNGTVRTPADAAGFPLGEGIDLAALLADGPVMLGSAVGADGARPPVAWMLAVGFTADGTGLLANDPATGLQVVLGWDARTRTVGGVTAAIDPQTRQPRPLGAEPPAVARPGFAPPAEAWAALASFKPATYVAIAITRDR